MRKIILICVAVIGFILIPKQSISAQGTINAVPITFYTATRPAAPMTWYPDKDPECFLPPYCMNLFYAPNMIYENGKYKMWTTVDDMIFYAESVDGNRWTNGRIVMSGMQNNWENDTNCRIVNGANLCGGMSNPVVVSNVTVGWKYTMYYTAGPVINTPTNGGMGVAFSNDGINWTRYSGNPVRRFIGGGTYAANAMKIGNTRYIYYYGGGASDGKGNATEAPNLIRARDLGNGLPAPQNDPSNPDEPVNFGDSQTNKTAYPIASDAGSSTCWMYNRGVTGADWGAAGPIKFQIYKGSDCVHNLGNQVAEITSALTGSAGNGVAGAGIKERDGNGQVISGITSLQIYFSAGDIWAGWQPKSVAVTFPSPTPTPTSGPTATPTPATPHVDGDFTGDGKVNVLDFVLFMNYWFFKDLAKGDLNHDGKINAIDYTVFMNYWYSYNQSH